MKIFEGFIKKIGSMVESGNKQRSPDVQHAVKKTKEQISTREKMVLGTVVRADPDHRFYSADRSVSRELASGESAVIAAIDGVGEGEKDSALAAGMMQKALNDMRLVSEQRPPTIGEGTALLTEAIMAAAQEIKLLKQSKKNAKIDTTVSAGMICCSPDGTKRFLVTANVGDSQVYRYSPVNGELMQCTKDHSRVQRMVDAGIISPEEAFHHDERNVVSKTVGRLEGPEEIQIQVTEIGPQDIVFAVSDGWSDNIEPKHRSVIVRKEFEKAKGDPDVFVRGLADRASTVMESSASYAKKDDVAISAAFQKKEMQKNRPPEKPTAPQGEQKNSKSLENMDEATAAEYFQHFREGIMYRWKREKARRERQALYLSTPQEIAYDKQVMGSKKLGEAMRNPYIQRWAEEAMRRESGY